MKASYEKYATIRNKRGLKDAHVAKNTGISSATLSSWHTGAYCPNTSKLIKIANFLNVPIESFFDEFSGDARNLDPQFAEEQFAKVKREAREMLTEIQRIERMLKDILEYGGDNNEHKN